MLTTLTQSSSEKIGFKNAWDSVRSVGVALLDVDPESAMVAALSVGLCVPTAVGIQGLMTSKNASEAMLSLFTTAVSGLGAVACAMPAYNDIRQSLGLE